MRIPLFDAHCDTVYRAALTGQGLRKNTLHTDLTRGTSYAPYAQVFAIWERPAQHMEMDFSSADAPSELLYAGYENLLSKLLRELDENSDLVSLCLSAGDARNAAENAKISAFISVEGAELLKCSLDCLWSAYELGVRIVNITWNYDNVLSGAAMGRDKGGLTDNGKAFLRFAQAIGVAVDVSHISERAFWDIISAASRPVIASHSCSGALCGHSRNLSDEQFIAIRNMHGVVGINFCPDFLGGGRDTVRIADHIEHFLSLGGEKTIAIGGDLDGIDSLPRDMRGIEDVGLIYEELLRRNYYEELIRDIFYENFLCALEKML